MHTVVPLCRSYNGPRTASGFLDYIKKALEADKGFARVEALDAIAKKFAAADDKAALVKEAQTAVSAMEGDDKAIGELYVKFMEKAVEKVRDATRGMPCFWAWALPGWWGEREEVAAACMNGFR